MLMFITYTLILSLSLSLSLFSVPYVVILLKCLKEFQKRYASSSPSSLPKTSQERAQFKDLIREAMALKPLSEPENFEEALNAAYRVSSPTTVRKKQIQILNIYM